MCIFKPNPLAWDTRRYFPPLVDWYLLALRRPRLCPWDWVFLCGSTRFTLWHDFFDWWFMQCRISPSFSSECISHARKDSVRESPVRTWRAKYKSECHFWGYQDVLDHIKETDILGARQMLYTGILQYLMRPSCLLLTLTKNVGLLCCRFLPLLLAMKKKTGQYWDVLRPSCHGEIRGLVVAAICYFVQASYPTEENISSLI